MRSADRAVGVRGVTRPLLSFLLVVVLLTVMSRTSSGASFVPLLSANNSITFTPHPNHSPLFRPVSLPPPVAAPFTPVLKFTTGGASSNNWTKFPPPSATPTKDPMHSSPSHAHLSYLSPVNSKILPSFLPKGNPVIGIGDQLDSGPILGSEQRISPTFTGFDPHSEHGRSFLYSYQTSHPGGANNAFPTTTESDLSVRIRSLEDAVRGGQGSVMREDRSFMQDQSIDRNMLSDGVASSGYLGLGSGIRSDLGLGSEMSDPFPGASLSMGSSYHPVQRQMSDGPIEVTHELPPHLPSYILDQHKEHMPIGTQVEMVAGDGQPQIECRSDDEEECHSPPKVLYKLKKVKKKKPEKKKVKIVYKVKKIYVPKPYPVIKKVKVVKKVPKVVYKDKIKVKTIIKKVPIIKKIKVKVPVKYIKEKKIYKKIYKIKKVKVPVIKKVVQFVPAGNVKHVHVHMLGKKPKKMKKKMGKKMKACGRRRRRRRSAPESHQLPLHRPLFPVFVQHASPTTAPSALPQPSTQQHNLTAQFSYPFDDGDDEDDDDDEEEPVTSSSNSTIMSKRFGLFGARRRSQEIEDCSDILTKLTTSFARFIPGLGGYMNQVTGQQPGYELDSLIKRKKRRKKKKRRRRKRREVERSLTLAPRIFGFLFHDDGWAAYGPTVPAAFFLPLNR